MNVLVVDDDDLLRHFLRQTIVRKLNGTVVEAKNGVEAMKAVERMVPDVILLDLWMPLMGGEEFLKRLRMTEMGKDVPVIVMSAVKDRDTIGSMLKLKIQDYLIKPVTMEQVTDRLTQIMAGAH